jgi:hypothetical protein
MNPLIATLLPTRIWNRVDSKWQTRDGDGFNIRDIGNPVDALRGTRRSLIRWGDGESNLITGWDVHFQSETLQVRLGLSRVLRDAQASGRYVLALPIKPLRSTKAQLVADDLYDIWSRTRLVYKFFANRNVQYADSLAFRELRVDPSGLWDIFSRAIVLHHDSDRVERFARIWTSLDIEHVKAPSSNAAQDLPRLEREVHTLIMKAPATTCVLVAAGPAGKILAHRLSPLAPHYDLGHFLDFSV